jgi:hypothetical protein
MLGYGGYLVYFQFCKQAFPEIAEQTVAQIVSGIAIKMVPGRVGLGPCRSKHSNMPAMTLPEPLSINSDTTYTRQTERFGKSREAGRHGTFPAGNVDDDQSAVATGSVH